MSDPVDEAQAVVSARELARAEAERNAWLNGRDVLPAAVAFAPYIHVVGGRCGAWYPAASFELELPDAKWAAVMAVGGAPEPQQAEQWLKDLEAKTPSKPANEALTRALRAKGANPGIVSKVPCR